MRSSELTGKLGKVLLQTVPYMLIYVTRPIYPALSMEYAGSSGANITLSLALKTELGDSEQANDLVRLSPLRLSFEGPTPNHLKVKLHNLCKGKDLSTRNVNPALRSTTSYAQTNFSCLSLGVKIARALKLRPGTHSGLLDSFASFCVSIFF